MLSTALTLSLLDEDVLTGARRSPLTNEGDGVNAIGTVLALVLGVPMRKETVFRDIPKY